MLDVFNIAKPQNCDIQTFYGSAYVAATTGASTWVKPRGVSNIYMLLIGSGGAGNGSFGGACGSVTVWYGSANNVPDVLYVNPSAQGTGYATTVSIRNNSSSGAFINLLVANSPTGISSAGTSAANQFAASGFYQNINGVGGSGGDPGASTTTFLQPGGVGTNTANYGYVTSGSGFFQMQPIFVSAGAVGAGRGGVGSGGGSTNNSLGGNGLVLIASW